MTDLYYPTGCLRDAAELVMTTSIGDRLERTEHPAYLTLSISPMDVLTLSGGEAQVFTFLASLAGQSEEGVKLRELFEAVDTATFKTCYRAYGLLLGIDAEVAS